MNDQLRVVLFDRKTKLKLLKLTIKSLKNDSSFKTTYIKDQESIIKHRYNTLKELIDDKKNQ